MAHKKGVGSSKNGRESESKRLGVKIFGGQKCVAGNIIIRQRGTKYRIGTGVGLGRDHTVYALKDGIVYFQKKKDNRTYVSVVEAGTDMAELKSPTPNKAKAKKPTPAKKTDKAAEAKKEAKIDAPKDEVKEETPLAAPAPEVKEEEPKAKKKTTPKGDDLKKIEGIGPKIAEILTNADLGSFKALGASDANTIAGILEAAGSRYKSHDPTTWPEQARMADAGDWDALKKWQDELDGGRVVEADDLTKIEGVGPKINGLLQKGGIKTFSQLAKSDADKIKAILDAGGSTFASHDPTTWPQQAQLAADGKWDELKQWQDELDGGKVVEGADPDDLTKVEGIGPKINELLQAAGINTFAQLAKANVEQINKILEEGGSQFTMHDPTTWPQQAQNGC